MTHTAEFAPDPQFEAGHARHPRRARGPREKPRQRLDTDCLTDAVRPLAETLEGRVVGQGEAIESLVCAASRLFSGLRDASRPLMTSLLLGPTGVGKTETARALAEALFGFERAMLRVNCEEYAHGHEISKLLGSPPGYVGHQIEPLLSQERVDGAHRKLTRERLAGKRQEDVLADRICDPGTGSFASIVLFDEIEKAHPTLWNALLGVLDDGVLTLGNNDTTDFTRTAILMTSNVGSAEMGELMERREVGFGRDEPPVARGSGDLRQLALKSARASFPLEFMNRFDEVLVYSALERADLELIFDKFLADVHDRAHRHAGVPILIRPSAEARGYIVDLGTDLRFGARPLRRAVERELVDPLSRLIASEGIAAGDVIEIEVEGDELAFFRRRGGVEAGVVVA